MSPSRRSQFVPTRRRSELYTAIAVGVGIVVGTALIVWLIRPGTPGIPGGGGLFNRQPRITILVILAALVLAGAVSYLLRGRRRPKRLSERGAIAVGSVSAILLAVLAGIFWPDGVIKHYPKQPKFSDTPPVTNPVPITSPTTPTTVKGSSTTVKTGTTVKPGTTVPTSTPTTVASSTTTKGR
jgi:type II secretory pathway pseudopilin PulG